MKRHIFILVFATIALSWANVHAGTILKLAPTEYTHETGIVVRNAPSIHGKRIGKIYSHDWSSCTVEWTGDEENGWIRIKETNGWVFGEFFGICVEDGYQAFEKLVIYVAVLDEIIARCEPSILSGYCGYCRYSGARIPIVGRKGSWLKTLWGNWIYHELLEPLRK